MKVLNIVKKLAQNQLVKNANCTTSFHAYQPKPPKNLKQFKK